MRAARRSGRARLPVLLQPEAGAADARRADRKRTYERQPDEAVP